ncbi:MAG: ATP-dependent DNA helicase RecG [Oscillospiraceae bacterium]|nr:ATP-dependent DNA helicase RecG [Oscillospiraceae bacterium]
MGGAEKEIKYLKGVGEARSRLFAKLGLRTLRDLLRFFPRDYEDRSVFKTISEAVDCESVSVRAMVAGAPRLSRTNRGQDKVRVRIVDDSGAAELTFFNQAYVKDALKVGETYDFYGKIKRDRVVSVTNPVFERVSGDGFDGQIFPLYHLTAKLGQRQVASAVRQALNLCGGELPNALPRSVEERYGLCRVEFAYENIHFPADFAALASARRRFLFEELFVIAALSSFRRRLRASVVGTRFEPCDLGEFYAALPFSPTAAQRRAVGDAVRDCASGLVMNRLVQGDVGSGKTLVAMALCYLAAKNGAQAAFMAPTELLAEQHYRSFIAMLEPLGLRVGLLTGSLGAKAKREAREALVFGQIDVVVGTHALISDGVEYNNLGLVITDEQHRFGVNQRAKLGQKGASPHVLVMSATPIPRTLSLILYGDLDVSIIDELPPGRQKIETYSVSENKRERTYNFVRKLVGEGRQVYIVCPSIEDNEDLPNDLKHAREYADALQSDVFPDLTVGLVHGAMKPKEKDEAMAAFVAGATQILVATTVIEVGVDVPNAALMVVENAERFGLSQLHQLRGRVGRGKYQSYCVLMRGAEGEKSRERLNTLCGTNDGFEIAEADLRQRGPGDFFGARQSGIPASRFAELAADGETIISAREAANAVLGADAELTLPENAPLRERVDAILAQAEGTIN